MPKVIDMHCDTIPKMYDSMKEGKILSLAKNNLQIDLDKLEAGNYLCQCFSLFTHLDTIKARGITPFAHVNDLADFWIREIGQYPDRIRQAKTYQDILDNEKAGVVSAIMTAEEGAVFEGKIENLHAMYDKGVRIATVTWNYPNELGFPNPKQEAGKPWLPDFENGLTKTGFEFMEEMEGMGMLIDVSHLNDAGIRDVFACTKGPVIATHSNARALHYHLRNLADENIKKIGERGGVIGVNFFPDFLIPQSDNLAWDQHAASSEDMVAHMKYLKNIGGIGCVALGTDFDGFSGYTDIEDASFMPRLADVMHRGGFTDDEIDMVFYKNFLRTVKDAWK